jgi:hypothetical protein
MQITIRSVWLLRVLGCRPSGCDGMGMPFASLSVRAWLNVFRLRVSARV